MKKYKDSKGKKYKLGDIVLNPFFGDMWVVQKWDEQYMDKTEKCPYCFAQYGFQDNYCMGLDEPIGFSIIASKGDEQYDKLLEEVLKVGQEIIDNNQ